MNRIATSRPELGRAAFGARICLLVLTPALANAAPAQTKQPAQSEELSVYQQRLNSIWQTAKTDPALTDLRRFATDLDDADSKAAVVDRLSQAVGIGFRGETPEQRVEAASTYLATAVKILDEIGDVIVDVSKKRSYRGRAMKQLGVEAPHPAYLPLLRAIVASDHEPRYVRYAALTAISQIPHDTVVEDLIVYLDDDELSMRAWEQLRKLTRSGILLRDDAREAMRADYVRWWEKNKRTFKYDRARVMREH